MADAGGSSLAVSTADVQVAVSAAGSSDEAAAAGASPRQLAGDGDGGASAPKGGAAGGGGGGREYDADDHLLSLPALAARYGVALDLANPAASAGLAASAIPALLAKHGHNVLTPPVETPWWVKYLSGFLDPFMLLLLMAGCFCILASSLLPGVGPPDGWDPINFILGLVLYAVVILTVTMNYIQDRQTSAVMATFKKMLPAQCTVIRDGRESRLAASELVPGDLVLLSLGDRVPADVRLIDHRELKVEASSLTGESDAISCSVEAQHELPAEARNLIFNSSLVMNGEGRGVVVRTGDTTMIGSIAKLASQTATVETTMQIEVKRVVHFVTILAFVSAIVFFSIGVARFPTREGALRAFINGFIVVLVANVPEGLPATVASCLTITAKRMATKHVFIKKTAIIETLGSASVICSDKTGTLTQNKMTVENMWLSRNFVAARSGATKGGDWGGGSGMNTVHSSLVGGGGGSHANSVIYGGTVGVANRSTRGEGTAGRVSSASGHASRASRSALPGVFSRHSNSSPVGASGTAGAGAQVLPPLASQLPPARTRAGSEGGAAALASEPLAAATSSSSAKPAVINAPPAGPLGSLPEEESGASASPLGSPVASQSSSTGGTPTAATAFAARAPSSSGGAGAVPTAPPASSAAAYGGLPSKPHSSSLQVSTTVGDRSVNSLQRMRSYGGGYMSVVGGYGSFRLARGGAAAALHPALSWRHSTPFLKLVAAAGLCNRARFVAAEEPAAAAAGAAAPAAAAGANPAPVSGGDVEAPPVPQPPAAPVRRAHGFNFASATERRVLGDASDTAFLRYVDSIVPVEELRSGYKLLHEIPFNSVNKWSYALVADPDDAGSHIGLLKGAPEIVLTRCTHYLAQNGSERPIDDEFREEHGAAYERFGFSGERVLGFAYRSFAPPPGAPGVYSLPPPTPSAAADGGGEAAAPPPSPFSTERLVFLGLISLVDPPREGVDEAVARCRAGGIRVTMVTGDHPLTAEAIARKVGIITLPTARDVAFAEGLDDSAEIPLSDPRVRAVVRSGAQIRGLSQEQWDELLSKEEVVFARTSPQQKLEICEGYQRLGHIVAMTGDGVNDSPALKKANIGVAMGSAAASDVAREAAEIILMDDNFASIVVAIEEGRTLFDNLKKSIAYTLSHLWPELFPVALNLIFSFPLGLPGLIILVIDLITEQGPAISFAYERAEEAVMRRPPRDLVNDRLISPGLLFYAYAIAGVGNMLTCMFAYFVVYQLHGVPISQLAWSAETYWQAGSPDLIVPGRAPLNDLEQIAVYRESVGAWYATLIACQFWNVFACKTRFVSLREHGVFDNFVTIVGVAFELAVLVLVVYVPFLQDAFQTSALSGKVWPIQLLFGVYIFTYTECAKAWVRKHPDSWFARNLAW